MAAREHLSVDEARRVLLAAQGFGSTASTDGTPAGRRQLVNQVRRLGLVQIDSVNALTRAHYLPLFSRLGTYDRSVLDRAGDTKPRAVFEYWGHEASLLPVETQPLLRWRMQEQHQWSGVAARSADEHRLRDAVADAVRELGPITAADLERHLEHDGPADRTDWGWNWSAVKRMVESLFWCGEVTSAGRDSGFRRRYAAPERVLPERILAAPTPTPQDSIVALVEIAARALGVATAADLRDYFRLPARETRVAIEALTESGDLRPTSVPDWPAAWMHRDARVPRRVDAAALLVPFDPLIWHRERVERVFGMRFRIEIYVPEPKREFGYYVLPFLQGDRLTARVDLRADRRAGLLSVRGAWTHHDGGMPAADPAPPLAQELRHLATWLGLRDVEVRDRGDLTPALASLLD